MRRLRQLRQRCDGCGDSLARVTRTDQQEERRVLRDLVSRSHPFAMLAQARMERDRVHRAVDHRQAIVGEGEARLDLVAHHFRIADDRAQPRAREELPFHPQACTGATGSARRSVAPRARRRAGAPRARPRGRHRRHGRCRSRAAARAIAPGWPWSCRRRGKRRARIPSPATGCQDRTGRRCAVRSAADWFAATRGCRA